MNFFVVCLFPAYTLTFSIQILAKIYKILLRSDASTNHRTGGSFTININTPTASNDCVRRSEYRRIRPLDSDSD